MEGNHLAENDALKQTLAEGGEKDRLGVVGPYGRVGLGGIHSFTGYNSL